MSFPKVSGDKLTATEANNSYKQVALSGETIDAGVSAGDLVYFDGTNWKKAISQFAGGIYAGSNVVVTNGYANGLSGLSVGQWHGKDFSGNLNVFFNKFEQCVGYAISATELILNFGGLVSNPTEIMVMYNVSGDGLSYINFSSLSNSLSFGTLYTNHNDGATCSSPTRGIFAGAYVGTTVYSIMSYLTFSNKSAGSSFGELSVSRYNLGSCSSEVRGIFAGGRTAPSTMSNVIDYVTIANNSNATNFGDMARNGYGWAGCSSPTRGLFGGALDDGNERNFVDYVTITSTGNATNFGTLSTFRNLASGGSSNVRGLFGGGHNGSTSSNVIDYVTIASTGNATDFGDLSVARERLGAGSNKILCIFAGGNNTNVLDYVTIASTGNATDFGDLSANHWSCYACSNSHGGLI